jgi:hypothetical protein
VSPNGSARAAASRYEFIEVVERAGERTLRIQKEDRNTVFVLFTPTCLLVQYEDGARGWYTQPYGLFEYYSFARDVAHGLMRGWEPPEGRRGWPGVHAWAWRQTGRAIGKRLHAFYKRCLREADPTVLTLQRAVFAATFSAPSLLLSEELYKERYIVKDVIQHRAAAVALASLERLRYLDRSKARLEAKKQILNSRELGILEGLAASFGVKLSMHVTPKGGYRQDHLSAEQALVMMENWRGLFSPTGEPYRSLDRTLMNLPGGVPPGLAAYLRLVYLERPVFSRSELVVLTLHEQWRFDRELQRRNEAVFQSASEDRIARATRLIAEHTRNPLSTRRTTDLKFVVGFLMDYPEEHRGNIVGLAERSIRWHGQQQEQETERILGRLGRNTPTEPPPIPAPQDPNVRFLSDVKDVCDEGLAMNNCVASYAGMAARGICYLFHVSHVGEEATIEVDRAGRVVQAAGPRNRVNAASRWGRRVLGRWGKGFPEEHAATPPSIIPGNMYDPYEQDMYGDMPF